MTQVHCTRCGRLCQGTPSADGEATEYRCPNKHGTQKVIPIEKPPAPPATLEELADKAADALLAAAGEGAQVFIFAHKSGDSVSQIRNWDPPDLAKILGDWFFEQPATRHVDPELLLAFANEMERETIPAIVQTMTERQRLASEHRGILNGEKENRNAGSADSVGASEQPEGASSGQSDPAGD